MYESAFFSFKKMDFDSNVFSFLHLDSVLLPLE